MGGAEAGSHPAAADPAQSTTPPRRAGVLENPAGQSLPTGGRHPCKPQSGAHVRLAQAYLAGGRQPLAVGHGGVGGLGALTRLPRPLGLLLGPDVPEERELRPEESHSHGPSPAHGDPRLRTSAAQRCERGRPGTLMGAAAQPALRAPMRGRSPGGRLAGASPRGRAGRQHHGRAGCTLSPQARQLPARSALAACAAAR